LAEFPQQHALDFFAGDVLHMQNAALRMSAFTPKIELAMTFDFAFIEVQTELHQLANPLRPFGHDLPNDRFIAQSCARFEFVSALLRFVITATEPCRAAFNANVSPAMPLPMTTKSYSFTTNEC